MTLSEFVSRVADLERVAFSRLEGICNLDDLSGFFQEYLGKKGELPQALRGMKDLDEEGKREAGPKVQQLKNNLSKAFTDKQNRLELVELEKKLAADWLDVTEDHPSYTGRLHPISQIQKKIEEVFSSMGFVVVDGPEVETEWHNFDALNIPPTHPARDMQDTFFVKTGDEDTRKNSVMRTHGTCMDIREMVKNGVPVRAIAPGRVFRNEEVDATHDATFYQVDGVWVDEGIHLGHLKGVLEEMLSAVFEREMKIRIRPGYFPFVEPGLEVDIWWEFVDKKGEKQGKWLEFMGAGMLHPSVLRNSGVDPEKYQGFAFGLGLTRLVMLKYEIDDIRLLSQSKREFLSQF